MQAAVVPLSPPLSCDDAHMSPTMSFMQLLATVVTCNSAPTNVACSSQQAVQCTSVTSLNKLKHVVWLSMLVPCHYMAAVLVLTRPRCGLQSMSRCHVLTRCSKPC